MLLLLSQSLSCVQLFATPWTAAHHAPRSMGFPMQEYWSGLPFPSPGDLPNPGIKLMSPALPGGFFTNEPSGKPQRFGHAFIQSETSPHGLTAYWVLPSYFPFLQEVWATSSLDPGKVSHGAGDQNKTWLQASTLPLTNAEPSSIATSLRLRFFICKTGLIITSWRGIILNEIRHVIPQMRGLARADMSWMSSFPSAPTSKKEPRGGWSPPATTDNRSQRAHA